MKTLTYIENKAWTSEWGAQVPFGFLSLTFSY